MIEDVRAACRSVLNAAWVPHMGYCVPNPRTYPHLWLWDSCFHSLAWMGQRDPRCLQELSAIFVAQTESGFVPHMRYLGRPTYGRGPRRDASSLTQPPIYGLVIERLTDAGWEVPKTVTDAALRAISYLWLRRRTGEGLLALYHPWESGADDSPRWDSWVGTSTWSRWRFALSDRYLLYRMVFDSEEAACGSRSFVSCPAAFNAIAGYTAGSLGRVTGDPVATSIADQLAESIDAVLWNEDERLWDDLPKVGRGQSQSVPTLDGVLGALITRDSRKAMRALDQVVDPDRFGAPYGVRYLPRGHRLYEPDLYWRGPAWPQMNYLLWLAAYRWNRDDVIEAVQDASWRSAASSSLAEYWNPETGNGRGAIPQTWATLVTAVAQDFAPPSEFSP